MIDALATGGPSGVPTDLTMPSSAKMGDTIVLIDATRSLQSNCTWRIDPNGLKIHTPGSGLSTWSITGNAGIQYKLVYFESTRLASLSGWVVREIT